MPLRRAPFEPSGCSGGVFRHTLTVQVHQSQVVLCAPMAALRCVNVPAEGVGERLGCSDAVRMHEPEIELRFGEALVRSSLEPA